MTNSPSQSAVIAGHGAAADYARRLLADLGVGIESRPGPTDPHPALAWADSGAMALCGHADGLPRVPSGPLASCAAGVGRALAALGARPPDDAAALLGERAALGGLARRGRIAPGGSCRLLRAADGWAALNLARPDDVRALPAWLELDAGGPAAGAAAGTSAAGSEAASEAVWDLAARELRRRPRAEWIRRARWLGLPFAAAAGAAPAPRPWLRVAARGPRGAPPRRPPRVLDFSSLWAGPLCAELLGGAGARVVKVESRQRPDGARQGSPAHYALQNASKRSALLDFTAPADAALLRALVDSADLVVESTRPRALAQLGVDAEEFVAARPGRVWVGLTGYGRSDAAPGRVAFGDDAGVAAGLACAVADDDGPLFCGDAIADPLAGLHAALAAWASWRAGGGALLDLSLRDVAAHALGFGPVEDFAVEGDAARARVSVADASAEVRRPRARAARRLARAPGADTDAVRRALGTPC